MIPPPPILELVPFLLTLLTLAVLPSVARSQWETRWFRATWAIGLTLPAVGAVLLRGAGGALLTSAGNYLDFLALMGTLYVVSGGILVEGRLEGTPAVNTALLGGGAVLASLLGTAGAATLLIRPYLHANRRRRRVVHGVVFLIILSGNIGGLLLPTGDPPLYIGFLRGVPFFWTLTLWREWVFLVGALLVVFYVWDVHLFRQEGFHHEEDAHSLERLRLRGWVNVPVLLAVIASAAFLHGPARLVAILACTAASWKLTPIDLRRAHGFTLAPVEELAWVFLAVFGTIAPVLEWLAAHALDLGVATPQQFYWASGGFSALLDSAPAYLTAFALARDLGPPQVAGVPEAVLRAISLGTVLFGALTYVGNGPNFLVRGIAEERGTRMPTFLGYAGMAAGLLLPLFTLVALLFL